MMYLTSIEPILMQKSFEISTFFLVDLFRNPISGKIRAFSKDSTSCESPMSFEYVDSQEMESFEKSSHFSLKAAFERSLVKFIKISRWVIILLVWMVILSGCSPSSLEDFHYEGETRCKALIEELQKIHNPEYLTRALPVLKKRFEDLVGLMIEAREFRESHPDESTFFSSDNTISRLLEEELRRIYAIEGGREVIECAQQEALVRLDAFERACVKKRQALR